MLFIVMLPTYNTNYCSKSVLGNCISLQVSIQSQGLGVSSDTKIGKRNHTQKKFACPRLLLGTQPVSARMISGSCCEQERT